MNIEQYKEIYESFKKSKDFIANIDKDFFLNFEELLFNELKKKDAVINEMAECMEIEGTVRRGFSCMCKEDGECNENGCRVCIKEHFTNKVEREGK